MKSGRELDLIVAEKVMGLTTMPERGCEGPWYFTENRWCALPFYSQNISAAWEVVEKMKEDFCISLIKDLGYSADFGGWLSDADTAPHAICLAALKAKGVEV
jgi:hypothetical protein